MTSVEVVCRRPTAEGGSMLGVVSLIGNFVTVIPNSNDENIIKGFSEKLEAIKQ